MRQSVFRGFIKLSNDVKRGKLLAYIDFFHLFFRLAEYSALSRKISSESDHPQSTSELEDDEDDANNDNDNNGFSHNVMEWAFKAKERLHEGRLASLSPWQSEDSRLSFSKVK